MTGRRREYRVIQDTGKPSFREAVNPWYVEKLVRQFSPHTTQWVAVHTSWSKEDAEIALARILLTE